MALFYTSFAAAVGLGSLAGAPVVQRLGFHAALWLSALICLVSLPVVLRLPARAHR
jgi:predicted MFS family arabinose efflux permease